jgi:hypothetical protein
VIFSERYSATEVLLILISKQKRKTIRIQEAADRIPKRKAKAILEKIILQLGKVSDNFTYQTFF